MAKPDEQVEQALLRAVNHDSNVNVRLSAVDALEKLAHSNPPVRQALVDAIPVQDSPLVQIALIEVLAQLNEPNAVPELRKLAKNTQADESVRQRAQWALDKLGASQ
jgi:HEAT repeat protein